MRSEFLKKLLPHVIAVLIFFFAAALIGGRGFKSDVSLKQSDVSGWVGMSKKLMDRVEEKGGGAYWTPHMFSGMPTYSIAYPTAWTPVEIFNNIFTLWMPKPVNFFFALCVGMYLLLAVLRLKPAAAILGALGFAFCSYSAIALSAGHETKVFTMAYIPATLAGLVLLYERKYIWGFFITALMTTQQLGMNHQQINYYYGLLAAFMTISYIILWVKKSQLKHAAIALSLAVAASLAGFLVNSENIMTLRDYTKDSKRGGQLKIDPKTKEATKTAGLDPGYAFVWSYGKGETFSLMFPGVKGYGQHMVVDQSDRNRPELLDMYPKLGKSSSMAGFFVDKFNADPDEAADYANQEASLYFGDQPGTDGPVYAGAIICMLCIIGLFIVPAKHRWWLLGITIFGILLSWGKNLPGFNNFMFNNLPLYNKFRVPSVALVIVQVSMAILAAMALDELIRRREAGQLTLASLKWPLAGVGAVFLIGIIMFFTQSYSKENKARTQIITSTYNTNPQGLQSLMDTLGRDPESGMDPLADNSLYERFLFMEKGSVTTAKEAVAAIQKDRKSAFGKDILRSLLFVVLALAALWLAIRNTIKPIVAAAAVAILSFIDIFTFSGHYINKNNFFPKSSISEQAFPQSAADISVLNDKDPNFRVFDFTHGSPFNESATSYYHKHIGGYSPAKLGIYDDLIEYQLSKQNPQVLNMLNTKYFIQQQRTANGAGQVMAIPNPMANGNAWFVKGIRFVNNDAEEMLALDSLNTKDSAVAAKMYQVSVQPFVWDSAATIRQTAFDNDQVKYESNTTTPQLAVFSEVWHKDWHVRIDGKETPLLKVNYVLRATMVPAGKHTIEFSFEPAVNARWKQVSKIGSMLMVVIAIGFLLWIVKNLLPVLKNARPQQKQRVGVEQKEPRK